MTDIFEAETGAKFIAADDMIVRWLRQVPTRRFEPETFKWIMDQLFARLGIFVDVGAATGWFSIPVLQSGIDVIGFECNRRVMARLQENCQLNGIEGAADLGRGVFHQAAASSVEGTTTFTYNPTLPLTSGGSVEPGVTVNSASEKVPTLTVDGSVSHAKVAVIKIDAEGHELSVLAGAAETIKRDKPALVLEANTREHLAVLAAWCEANGYGWQQADERNLLCLPS
ncbi:FkbM family methyltransferase [Roseicyclus marinus]|uniref:FkbM family methyltransferase n=1 Tax=Roseicyclus marinus TaxID=2161673 RepID=UPI00240FED33|nr:FkbM family methyltransferase [Roseicyclus marinus]MDG3040444.1 FkbM family methyltransferase [Roseicyclus marinus]